MSTEFKTDLMAYLAGQTSLTDLIGQRIYAGLTPQNPEYPCIGYLTISNQGHYAHDGDTELGEKRYQFDVLGDDPLECEQVGDVLRTLLSGFRGVMNSSSNVGSIFFDNEFDYYDAEIEKFRKSLDFRIKLNNTP